jgi:hypothetical protein
MLGGKGKGGRVGQRESPSGTEVSPCLRVTNLQKIFFFFLDIVAEYPQGSALLIAIWRKYIAYWLLMTAATHMLCVHVYIYVYYCTLYVLL